MKAGVISIDITPQMGAPLAGNPRPVNAAVGVHDPIAANIICLDDGDTRVFLIGMDLLGIEVDTCEKICAGITRATGVPGGNIMISATHTHSGPNAPRLYYSAYEDPQIMEKEAGEVETYLEQLVEKVVAGAVAAAKDMTECTLSFGQASDGRFSHNRRLRMKDGSICMIFEPYRLEDIVCLSDPVSADTVSVLKISAPDGKILALYVHYATHPAIACGLDFLVSRDFPGWMTDCLVLSGTGSLESLPAFQDGLFYVQDAAAKLSVLCAQLSAGEQHNILDCCAAPGGKSFAAAIAMGGEGQIHSCDVHAHKTGLISNGAARLGLENIAVYQQDATAFREEWQGKMDAVIADVPCSGYGIIRKKPDIRYKDPKTMTDLPQLQLQILKNQARYVKPGGVLLYSTCTLLHAENAGVVEAFLKENPAFILQPLQLPDVFPKNTTGMLTLVPGQYDTDGFFICKMRRNS